MVLAAVVAENDSDVRALKMLSRLHFGQGHLQDAAAVLERLVLASPPAEASSVQVRLAGIATTLEQWDRARGHLAAAGKMIAKDVAALGPIMRWADQHGDYQTVADLLGDVLMRSPGARNEIIVPVRLALARMLSKLDNRVGAEREARMAASAAPDHVEAQLAAARLQISRAETRHFALTAVVADPFCVDAYEILAQGFVQAQLNDAIGRCNQVLALLGVQDPQVKSSANATAAQAANPRAPLGRDGLMSYLADTGFPEWGRELLYRAGHKAQVFVIRELSTQACPDDAKVRALAYRTAAVFGVNDFELLLTDAADVTVAYDGERPQRLILGPLAMAGSDAEMRYHIGTGLASMLMGTSIFELLDDRDFLRLLQGLVGLAHNGFGDPDVVKQLQRFLPRRNRKSVIEWGRTFDPSGLRVDLGEWRRAALVTARRTGLLAARDVRAAASGLLRSQGKVVGGTPEQTIAALRTIPGAGDLLTFAVSDHYARVRRQLAMNTDPVARDGV